MYHAYLIRQEKHRGREGWPLEDRLQAVVQAWKLTATQDCLLVGGDGLCQPREGAANTWRMLCHLSGEGDAPGKLSLDPGRGSWLVERDSDQFGVVSFSFTWAIQD